jgi:outer membrane protein assembly factor BamB
MRWVRVIFATFVMAGTWAAVSPGPPVAAATVASTTTLAASPTSVTQDSWVTLTAQVRASGGVPAGSVTFTDVSNGSVLDTTALANGTAAFSTASLAPGTRTIVATYGGSSSFSPSSSAAVSIAVAAAGSMAVTFQTDASHDGRQPRGALTTGSLVKKWSRTMSGTVADLDPVSYPVIAHGLVFVTVQRTTGTFLYALNASNGTTEWSVNLGGSAWYGTLAYDGRRVFAVNSDAFLTAFVASTGQILWSHQFGSSVSAPPTAYDGVVYISTRDGTVYAVSEADGALRWAGLVLNGDESSPAVDNTGVYVSYAAQQDYRFSLGGQLIWHDAGCCSGGGGSTPVLHGNYVYVRGQVPDTPLILAKTSGTAVGTFASVSAPAFDSTNMYTLQGANLVAVSPSGSPNRWTFTNGSLVTAPVVNNGVVYTGSSNGQVYGVSASSGAKVWTGTAGTLIAGPPEDGIQTGLAIGGGLLVVPAGNVVTAFGD